MSNMGLRVLCREIRYYPHITALYLNNNKLVYIPEEVFLELRSLNTLDLSFNLLARLPPTLGQLSNLEKLVVNQNHLTELPLEIGYLYKLKDIQLEGNPITNPPQNILLGGPGIIVSYLRDNMPVGPPPPERRFISYIDPQTAIPGYYKYILILIFTEKDKLRVLSYNILADGYATPEQYYYCPSWALEWDYRKTGILKEISQHDCDIICLQEVEAKQYADYFQPEMSKLGYSGVFTPKSRARTMEDWSVVDGCVIFFKRARFNLIEQHIMEFQSIAMARHKDFVADPEAFARLMTKDSI
jgi:CCR4-NOT transcription complex subunit 6